MQERRIYKIIGELLMVTPLIVISFIINMGFHIIMILVLLIFYKFFFKYNFHALSKNGKIICLAMTYGIPLVIIMINLNFPNQYFLTMLLSLLSIYVCSYIGKQNKYNEILKRKSEIYKKLNIKDVFCMNENELLNYCLSKGIKGDKAEFVIMILIHEMKYEEIGRKLGYSVDALKDWSPICKKKLGIKSWK